MDNLAYQRHLTKPPLTTDLTTRQRQLLNVYADLLAETGNQPTVRQLGLHLKISSPNGVMALINILARKGYLLPPSPEAARQVWALAPKALELLRGVLPRWPYVRLRLLSPEVALSPEEARALAGQLLAAAETLEATPCQP